MMNPGQYQDFVDMMNEQTALLKKIVELLNGWMPTPFARDEADDKPKRNMSKPIVTKKPTKGN